MPRLMLDDRRRGVALGAVALLGVAVALSHWFAERRPLAPQLRGDREIVVTSEADQGPGSLREALFAAAASKERARVRLRAARIALKTALPPLVNPHGIVIEADAGAGEIDARGLKSGPVFVVDAPQSSLRAVLIRNAPEQAILVRANGLRVSQASLLDCDEGVHVLDGVRDTMIEQSRFEGNRIGVQAAGVDATMVVQQNRFSGHRDAAVWAVRAAEPVPAGGRALQVRRNTFDADRIAIVLGNVPSLVEDNDFAGMREAALYLIGGGAVARNNRIRSGAIGVIAETTQGAVIEANELDHNRVMGMLVRSSRGALISRNRMHGNGYGIAFVLGESQSPNTAIGNMLLGQQFDALVLIGDSPVLRANQALASKAAGLRILDFVPLEGRKVAAAPFLDGNRIEGNGIDQPVRGEYRVRKEESAR